MYKVHGVQMPPFPPNEKERLQALMALNIAREKNREFDIFVELAQQLFGVPAALISFIEEDQQWIKASNGTELKEIPRKDSFCSYTILTPDAFIIEDTSKDMRFCCNPYIVENPNIRFYAGVPILGPTGHALGTLCVLDKHPRQFSHDDIHALKNLAKGIEGAIKLHSSIQTLQTLCITDALTGLRNRVGFESECERMIHERKNTDLVGLLFMDLDSFKPINDLFGHTGGDAALKEVAKRLQNTTNAVLGRFGGDEFCILQKVQHADELHVLAARIHMALAQPFRIDEQSIPLSTSIGIAMVPSDADTPKSLIRCADTALYRAKQAGGGTVAFSTDVAGENTVAGRSVIQEMLRNALLPPGQEPFTLMFQPIYGANNTALVGFEALIRWPDSNGGLIMPSTFIPEAEASGLVVHLDRWVLNQACRLAAYWPPHLRISSNLSAANFFAGDLVRDVRNCLERNKLDPGRLNLEVTETILLIDPVRVKNIIQALQELGVRIVLDDFGVGYASLSYLRDYTFNGIKIDKSYTADLETDPRNGTFVRAIIDMARALNIETTAEGVETKGQFEILKEKGVNTMQGYLLGRPMTPIDAANLIIKNHSSSISSNHEDL